MEDIVSNIVNLEVFYVLLAFLDCFVLVMELFDCLFYDRVLGYFLTAR